MKGLWQSLRNFFASSDTLAPSEAWLLQNLLDRLPPHLHPIAQAQFACYDRRHREVDGRAINFYRSSRAQSPFPLLAIPAESAPLIRITVAVVGEETPVHATLHAVAARVFSMNFNRPVMALSPDAMQVIKVNAAWKSDNHFTPNN